MAFESKSPEKKDKSEQQTTSKQGDLQQSSSSSASRLPRQRKLTPQAILQLQRQVGNKRTQDIIQRAVGFEFEADLWQSYNLTSAPKTAPQQQRIDALNQQTADETAVQQPRGGGISSYGKMVPDEDVLGQGVPAQMLAAIPRFKQDVDSLTGIGFQTQAGFYQACSQLSDAIPNRVLRQLKRLKRQHAQQTGGNEQAWRQATNTTLKAEYLYQLQHALIKADSATINDPTKLGKIEGQYGKADAPVAAGPAAAAPAPLQNQVNVYAENPGGHVNNLVGQYGMESAGKKGALHEDAFFDIEADGPYEKQLGGQRYNNVMDIEFVTHPFEEDERGFEQLKGALAKMKGIMDRLLGLAGRDEAQGQFVGPGESGFSNTGAYLAGGGSGRSISVKMQVTQGVPLADIPKLFKAFGTPQGGETQQELAGMRSAQFLQKGSNSENTGRDAQAMGAAPGKATAVATGLKQQNVFGNGEDLSALVGLLSLAIAYIEKLQIVSTGGIKWNLQFMSRYSFDQLVQMLPANQIATLAQDANYQILKNLIIQQLGGDFAPANQLMTFSQNKPADRQLYQQHTAFFNMFEAITLDNWLAGIFKYGFDLLSKGDFQEIAEGVFDNTARTHEKASGIFLRGHGDSSRVRPSARGNLAIMENRGIEGPGALTSAELEDVALAYFQFLMAMRQQPAQQPDFPNMPVANPRGR